MEFQRVTRKKNKSFLLSRKALKIKTKKRKRNSTIGSIENGKRSCTQNRIKKQFKCNYCTKVYLRKQGLDVHVRNDHVSSFYMCKLCEKTFTTKKGLDFHSRAHISKNIYTCDYCNETFKCSTDASFFKHVDMHSKVDRFKCKICDVTFTRKCNLNTHVYVHLKPVKVCIRPEDMLFRCLYCGNSFKKKKDLVHHTQNYLYEICREIHFGSSLSETIFDFVKSEYVKVEIPEEMCFMWENTCVD